MADDFVPPHVARRRAREEAAETERARGEQERPLSSLRRFFSRPPASQEDQDIAEAYRTGVDVREIRRRRGEQPAAPAAPSRPASQAAPSRAPSGNMESGDVPGNRASQRGGAAAAERMREIDMQGADMPGNRAMSPPARPRPPARQAAPAPRRPRESEADRLNQMELDRIEQDRIDADRRGLAENARRRRETTPERGAEGSGNFFKDLGSFARAITGQSENYKKGGLVKPKGAIIKSKAKSPANLKGKTLMKKGGMAKGGEASLASGLRGGVVKKPGTDSFNFQAKKMATGGVVQKGGSKYGFTTAKTKMLRRGGMAKGCK